jgi:hypothetical protein
MKKLIIAVMAFSTVGPLVHAQQAPAAEVAAGYSAVYVVKGFTFFMQGGSSSAALNVNNWLGVVGDFGAYHAPSGVSSLVAETYMLGPRFSYRQWERVIPFGQVLVGGMHASAVATGFTDSSNAFAFGAGGGADLVLDRSERFALRPQIEYLGFRANGSTTNNVRLSMGIVLRIGRKQ